jgi:hypothetical protein
VTKREFDKLARRVLGPNATTRITYYGRLDWVAEASSVNHAVRAGGISRDCAARRLHSMLTHLIQSGWRWETA